MFVDIQHAKLHDDGHNDLAPRCRAQGESSCTAGA